MFSEKTVFILGAGASWHYGYPTGEQLVQKVIEKAGYACRYFLFSADTENREIPQYLIDTTDPKLPLRERWNLAYENCAILQSRLEQVHPLVIDYFLGWNPKLHDIGRLLIAWVILECEHNHHQLKGNVNRKELLLRSPLETDRMKANAVNLQSYNDNWCRFVIHQIATNCNASDELLKNNVHFVTFNYDMSLERALQQGLQNIERFDAEDIKKFLTENRVFHVYGSVRENIFDAPPALNWSEQSREAKNLNAEAAANYRVHSKSFLDVIYTASLGIRVIDPADKTTNKSIIDAAKSEISGAKCIYILGYGFDENNSERLDLSRSLQYEKVAQKSVYFTNLGNINRINKRVSKAIFGNAKHFTASGPDIEETGNDNYYERSIRNVYDAMELDFG